MKRMDNATLQAIARQHMGEGGLFVYDREALTKTAQSLLDIQQPANLVVRFAAKANPHPVIIRLFDGLGLQFDASSVREATSLIEQGVEGSKISLSSQILRDSVELRQLLKQGIQPVATSLRQLSMLAELDCRQVAVRVNPGIGSGHNNRTNVGGPSSSFGIWHEQLPEITALASEKQVTINRLHTHIGSGADSTVWRAAIQKSLAIVEQLADVTVLDIGGGYKVARMPDETATDMVQVCRVFHEELDAFTAKTGRKLGLEIEPGTYLVANAGTLLVRVEEVVETSDYKFLKVNAGMNALIRPSHYGSQHPIVSLSNATTTDKYLVVGPCCESGDILTPAADDPEGLLPRELTQTQVGDYLAIGGAGAYGKTMAAVGYNQAPEATELVH